MNRKLLTLGLALAIAVSGALCNVRCASASSCSSAKPCHAPANPARAAGCAAIVAVQAPQTQVEAPSLPAFAAEPAGAALPSAALAVFHDPDFSAAASPPEFFRLIPSIHAPPRAA